MLLQRDYYERKKQAGSRNGSKIRAVNIGYGEIKIAIPQVRGLERPFHSKILPPYVRQMDEIREVVPLLYYEWSLYEESERFDKKAPEG